MRPVLVDLGPIEVNSWGLMVAIALLLAGVALRSELERLAGRGDVAYSLILAAGLGGLIGARLYWLGEHAGDASLLDSFSGAGFTWYGGLLGGVAAVFAVARIRGVPMRALLDASGPALALGYGVGRIACQLAGDGTYGVASDLPWAMSYPHGEVPTTDRVHPTPVYETLASLLIFWFLWRIRKRSAPLQIFGLYLVLAGAERFLVEFIRRNDAVLLGLTQPQVWAVAMMAGGVIVLAWRKTSAERTSQQPAAVTAAGTPTT
jgi:phosphatidylglycerol---prolipoprotein diacylglyceryl transferase